MKLCSLSIALLLGSGAAAQVPLPPPSFHHLHLNSVDPDAAIDFYVRQFPSTVKSSFAGLPALKAGNALVVFTKVNAPPPTQPQTAIWHFGWYVVDVHQSLARFQQRPEVRLLPLYTTDEGGSVFVSSDTWPGFGGSLGRTKAQIADAKAKGIQPTHGAGFGYLQGPDGAIIEYQGNMPEERFNRGDQTSASHRSQLQSSAPRAVVAFAGAWRYVAPACRGHFQRRGTHLARPARRPAAG